MINTPNYGIATNKAYEVLSQYSNTFPKVDIFDIISKYENIKLHTYSEASSIYGCDYLYFYRNIASSEHGFTISRGNRFIVLFNEEKSETTIRFTLAHELGHILLGHIRDTELEKKEANCFARNLLCPLPIADGFNLLTPKDYELCFDISEPMATAVFALKSSDRFYITHSNYEKISDKAYCYFSGYNLTELYA